MSKVKDMSLAPEGVRKIEWVQVLKITGVKSPKTNDI